MSRSEDDESLQCSTRAALARSALTIIFMPSANTNPSNDGGYLHEFETGVNTIGVFGMLKLGIREHPPYDMQLTAHRYTHDTITPRSCPHWCQSGPIQ